MLNTRYSLLKNYLTQNSNELKSYHQVSIEPEKIYIKQSKLDQITV